MHAFPLAAAFALLIFAVMVAAAPGSESTTDRVAITEVRFYGCTAHFGYLPLNEIDAAALAPKGFGTQPWIGEGMDAPRASTVYAQHCARVETDTGHIVTDYTETMHLMRLAPPPEHAAPTHHNLPLRITTNDPVLAQVYHDWGWSDNHEAGTVTLQTTFAGPYAVQGTTVGIGPDWGMTISVDGPPLPGTWDGAQIRFYGTDDTGAVTSVSEFDIEAAHVWPAATINGQTAFTYTHGGASAQPGSAGFGQIFQWGPNQLTQTLTLLSVDPPPPLD